ncbi:MAG: hypothetical protein FD163_1712 [Hyphomonadaceae bacterium]|nr:MAG: hypothetical protein FD128_819 [Hyphomonadaceae bacterium]KAF0185015.1 MAG: hypothetical protein FD163_1712 [Hyphomonadaceae bacterium]
MAIQGKILALAATLVGLAICNAALSQTPHLGLLGNEPSPNSKAAMAGQCEVKNAPAEFVQFDAARIIPLHWDNEPRPPFEIDILADLDARGRNWTAKIVRKTPSLIILEGAAIRESQRMAYRPAIVNCVADPMPIQILVELRYTPFESGEYSGQFIVKRSFIYWRFGERPRIPNN